MNPITASVAGSCALNSRLSPRASPRSSPRNSPRGSPRHSPIAGHKFKNSLSPPGTADHNIYRGYSPSSREYHRAEVDSISRSKSQEEAAKLRAGKPRLSDIANDYMAAKEERKQKCSKARGKSNYKDEKASESRRSPPRNSTSMKKTKKCLIL